jgi:formylglycine-generating enzyme required for sulfatase activity
VEWQYAAKGGQLSKGYIYPGSNDLSDIADSLRYYAVGTKLPNELNLHDMFGIQYEWNCDNSYLPLEHFLKNNSDEKTTVENPYFFCFYGEGLDKRSKTYSGFRWFKNDAKYAYLHSSRITIDDANFNFRVVKVFHKLDTITFPIQKK